MCALSYLGTGSGPLEHAYVELHPLADSILHDAFDVWNRVMLSSACADRVSNSSLNEGRVPCLHQRPEHAGPLTPVCRCLRDSAP